MTGRQLDVETRAEMGDSSLTGEGRGLSFLQDPGVLTLLTGLQWIVGWGSGVVKVPFNYRFSRRPQVSDIVLLPYRSKV